MTDAVIDGTSTDDEMDATLPVVVDGLIAANWTDAVIESILSGAITAFNATCAVWEGTQGALDNIAAWYERCAREPRLTIIHSAQEIMDAGQAGRSGVILGFQNAAPIGDDLRYLALFKRLGVGIIQLTYNTQNLIGGGCFESVDRGLSDFGRDVVAEMNRTGVAIDLSHVGEQTAWDVLDCTARPVAVSHTVPSSFYPHARNKSDELLRMVASSGGIVGVCSFPSFLPHGQDSTIDDYVEAIERAVECCGERAVGIGTDSTQDQGPEFLDWITHDHGYGRRLTTFGSIAPLADLDRIDKTRNLIGVMRSRGWAPHLIERVMGLNWVDYLDRVWDAERATPDPTGGANI